MTRENTAEKNLAGDESGNHSRNNPGNPIWRDGAMTELQTRRPFQLLADHLSAVARCPEGERLAARIVTFRKAGASPDLLELLARRDADGRPAIRVLERLATEAPEEQLAALALLYMLREDLEVVRDRLVQSGRVSALDAESDALAAAWEVVTRRPPPSRWDRGDAIWNLARRVSRMRRRSSAESAPLPEGFDKEEPESDRSGRPVGLLARAVAAGVLTPREVVLIAQTRIEGRSLTEVAKVLGRPYDAARMERRRAEATLRTFLRRYDSDGSS
jgi:DNA-directed RNA polymerase specialized sigma24 family protein